MRYYFAPLEGLTDRLYRKLHHQFFPGADRYYTPFLSPTVHRCLTPKEQRELPLADTLEQETIPQLLTKNADDFLWMAQQCAQRGYTEVNLNLGCPSGTVTAKGKGSGMLTDTDSLDRFLDAVFQAPPLDISIKTRIGFQSPEEFPAILDVYNRYPIKELIIHPRVRSVFYKGSVNKDAYRYATANSSAPLCFNGNLCTLRQIRQLAAEFPQTNAVMLGRGLIADPGMLSPEGTTIPRLQAFHQALLDGYIDAFGGARNAMFRMKEHWSYLTRRFDGGEALFKQLRKTTDLGEYAALTEQIFATVPLKEELFPDW